MTGVIAKIEENARRRLVLPPLSRPADELPRYRHFLKVETGRLKILHKGGASGLEVCQARAAMMDVLIRYIWDAVIRGHPGGVRSRPRITLVAYGGYGRGELAPFSDVDLLFLHDIGKEAGEERRKTLAEWTGGLLYTLWDIGLKVGHAVRSIPECLQVAGADMQALTALLEARRITGDEGLFDRFRDRFEARCVRGHEAEYIRMRMEDQRTRRAKHGNSPALQEPNVKNGVGGLRDFQNLLWMAWFKHRTRSLEELQSRDFLGSGERRQLEAAHDFLLRTRTELHLAADRALDVLAANVKPRVASGLGYADRSPRIRVEKFMRDYYTHARNIFLITRTLEQRMALLEEAPRPRSGRRRPGDAPPGPQFDGFRVVDGQLLQVYRTALSDDPRRFLRAFLHCQKRGLRLHPDLAQLMRQQVALVDRGFLSDPHNHTTFLEILNQPGNVAPALRAMHEVGFLGKFLPEFGRLTNLVQHEFYHQYAVDEHTLTCIEKLDAVWSATEAPQRNYTALLRGVERPFVLHLALLLHDCGKALDKGRHELVGGELALRAARRLRLDGATTHTLRLLIELHLAMVQISQRRDLEDSEVIQEFAAAIQSREQLDLLTLHTYADSMGTSDTLWNGFKDSLLWSLHHKTAALLSGGTEFLRAEERRRELLREEVRGQLPKTFGADEIEAHFAGLPDRYFRIHSAREIARDLTLAHQFMYLQLTEADRALEPVIAWHDERDRGCSSVHVCTWDRAGLFSKIAGSLTASSLNIHGAQIFTRADGIVLDTFDVTDARTGALPGPEARTRFDRLLDQVLTGDVDLARAMAKAPQYQALWYGAGGERMAPRVRFDHKTLPNRTIIDVEAEDRVGLLYALSVALNRLRLNLVLAKVVTEKGAALDTFYVTELDGKKVKPGGDREAQIARRLREAAEADPVAR